VVEVLTLEFIDCDLFSGLREDDKESWCHRDDSDEGRMRIRDAVTYLPRDLSRHVACWDCVEGILDALSLWPRMWW
jgi:hypothetical protein